MKSSRGGPPRGDHDDLSDIVQEDSLAAKIALEGKRKAKAKWQKKIPPPRVRLEASTRARMEEAAFADGSLQKQAKENAHKRDQETKAFIHRNVLRGMLVVGWVFLTFFLVWGWHYIAPSQATWLGDRFAGLDGLIRHLLSGAAGAFLVKQIDKHMQ